MESACVYEQKTVIHELSEGIQMAKQLRFNLNSGESREFLIHKILSSYENALFVLKSGDFAGQPQPTALPAHSLPESSISIGSPKIGEFEFEQPFIYQQGQNAVSKERYYHYSLPTSYLCLLLEMNVQKTNYFFLFYFFDLVSQKGASWDDQVTMCRDNNGFETAYNGRHECQHGAQLAVPPTTDLHHHYNHQLPPLNPNEMLSNKRVNLSVNIPDFGHIIPSSFCVPSTPLEFTDNYQQLNDFLNRFDDEVFQFNSPPFISPESSESNYISDWGRSPSLDFAPDRVHVDPYFEFNNPFGLDGYYS